MLQHCDWKGRIKMTTLTFTTDQLEAYLKRIGYGAKGRSRVAEVKSRIEDSPLLTLAELQRRQLSAIPWGNSGLHYTQHHTISINPQSVFYKLVQRRLDGYCMENTNLLYVVLRSLGYQVYPTGGRVSHAAGTGKDNGLYLGLYVCPSGYVRWLVLKRWQWPHDSDRHGREREIYGRLE